MLKFETPEGSFDVAIDHIEVAERKEWSSKVEFAGQITGSRDVSRIKGHVWVREGRSAPDGEIEVTKIIVPGAVTLGPMNPNDPAVDEILTGLLLKMGEGHPIMLEEMRRICGGTMIMKVTVITLYRGNLHEHFVGVVCGRIAAEKRLALAKAYNLDSDEEEGDVIFFTEVDLVEVSQLDTLRAVENSPYIRGNELYREEDN